MSLLGGFTARRGDGAPLTLTSKKGTALLAYLAFAPDRPRTRDTLVDLLWEDSDPAHARRSLRQALTVLRRALPSGLLETDNERVGLRRDAVRVDVLELRRVLADGSPAALRRARALYRGDLLDGFHARAPRFDAWLLGRREMLRQRAVQGIAALLAHEIEAGDREAAVYTAVRLLMLEPLHEPAHRALMRLHAEMGRRGAALRQYRLCRDPLDRELDARPEPETERLYAAIRAGAAEPASGAPPASRPPADEPLDGDSAERRPVTVLVADVADAADAADPEALHRRTTRLRARLGERAEAFGGTLVESMGGAIIVAFGLPRARGCDAERAVRAAVAVQADPDGSAVPIGVASGQVMVPPGVRDGRRRIVGGPVGQAARLQAMAAPGETLISAAARRALGAARRLRAARVPRSPRPGGGVAPPRAALALPGGRGAARRARHGAPAPRERARRLRR